MDGVEKMHSDDVLRTLRSAGYLSDRQRRRITRENELTVRRDLELTKYFSFQIQLFRGRLDNQIGGGTIVQNCSAADLL